MISVLIVTALTGSAYFWSAASKGPCRRTADDLIAGFLTEACFRCRSWIITLRRKSIQTISTPKGRLGRIHLFVQGEPPVLAGRRRLFGTATLIDRREQTKLG